MWTLSLIEQMASGYAEQKPWHACEKCKYEYQNARLAWGCYKSHFRSYERIYANLDTEVVKHEVVFAGGQPLCGDCASKVREDVLICVVRMENPPECIRCDKEIRDKPLAEVKPGQLPHSERHHDLILRPTKEAETDAMRYGWHKSIKQAGLNSIGARGTYECDPENRERYNAAGSEINAKMFKDFGPYQPDGNAGLVRTETGYLQVAKKEKVDACLPKC